MEYKDFEKLFVEELLKNNIDNISEIKKFYDYMKILLEWNKKINLTAINDEKEFIVKHFIDSLTIRKYLKDNNNVIDIGTGAGFPGIPLKISTESINMTLIDSVNKKVNVLNDIINKLNIERIEAIHIRAEEFAKNNREKYDVAVSRAVANMSTLVEYLISFVKIGGMIICMKGPNFGQELDESKKAISVLGGKIKSVETVFIDNEFERNIVVIEKIKHTPLKFPRGQSKPLKDPIK